MHFHHHVAPVVIMATVPQCKSHSVHDTTNPITIGLRSGVPALRHSVSRRYGSTVPSNLLKIRNKWMCVFSWTFRPLYTQRKNPWGAKTVLLGLWTVTSLVGLSRLITKEAQSFKYLYSLRTFTSVYWYAGEGVTFPKSPPSPAHAHDSPPAWTSPQRLKVTHLRFPCQRRAPPLFKLSLILQ